MITELRTAYRTVDDVILGLGRIEQHFLARRDRRGVFVTAYLEITKAIERSRTDDGFQDSRWTARYLVRFANLYRTALLDYEEGRVAHVPKSWRISFDAARADTGLVIQHLVLGINAHINHDLAVALHEVGIDPERPMRYADHVQINLILERATERMKRRVSTLYAPILLRLDRAVGRLDDDITSFSIPKAREHAWAFAVALAGTRSEPDRALLRRALDDQAAVLARMVLAPPTRHPLFLNTVRFVERLDSLANRVPRTFSPI